LKGKIIGTPFHGTHTLGNWESDRAIDVAAPVGTPVRAPFGGFIGSQFGSLGASPGSRFAGLRLHVQAPTGQEWYGAHLSRFAPGIRPGRRVKPGQLIGYSGSAAGVGHLHEALNWGDPFSLVR
jgi:peptidoglycan LD-endopeptidase LytH